MAQIAPIATFSRTCPLCEAGCGLAVDLDDRGQVVRIRGDLDDVLSRGYLCAKGTQLGELNADKDWLRSPMVKRDGKFVAVDWDEAFATIEAGLLPLLAEHGRDACGIYLGNPGVHNLALALANGYLIKALGSRNRFSASTVDQRPKEISAGLMFGSVTVPVPDLDRTDFLVMLGANPRASNGSLCTAPDFPGRLDRIQERGGVVVVVDPRQSETAKRADRHLAIRPGGDAFLLAAIANTMLSRLGSDVAEAIGRAGQWCRGLDELATLLEPFTPASVAEVTGLDPAVTSQLASDLLDAPSAAVYGRMGTCTQEFGTASSWLVDVVNLLSGNLDEVGGAMFATGAAGQPSTKGTPGSGKGMKLGRVRSRVSSQPETLGEFSVSVLAEEIETPGEGQIRAMIVVAGNPVSSCPNSTRLDNAFASLDFMVSVDPYINETSRHADVILPPPTPLQKSHYSLALLNFAVRNVANYSPAILPLDATQISEWEIMCRLINLLAGEGGHTDIGALDEAMARNLIRRAVGDSHGPVAERDPDELWQAVADLDGPERLLDIMVRTGPFGDGFGSDAGGLSLQKLIDNPHGVDLGPLAAHRLPDILRTPSGRIEVVPEPLVTEVERMVAQLDVEPPALVLVGRRNVRSNNSWMHNLRILMKGKNRCTMQIHPDDAAPLGLVDGEPALVRSRVGEVTIAAEVTTEIRPGVVSIPHGFGQDLDGVQLEVATKYEGVNANVLTDDTLVDPVSGNVALNGVPVSVAAATPAR